MSSEEGLKVKCVLRCGRVGGGGGRVNCLAGNTKGRERESPGPASRWHLQSSPAYCYDVMMLCEPGITRRSDFFFSLENLEHWIFMKPQ